jgi:hypothetical protein
LIHNTISLSILCCTALAAATVTTPTFLARRDYPSAGGHVSVADVNGDGIPDIIALGLVTTVSVLPGNGDGTFRAPINSGLNWEVIGGGAPLDLNGDGKVDLVIGGGVYGLGTPAGIGVCFGNGDGTFRSPILYQAGTDVAVSNPVLEDFNGDGIPDVVVPGSSGIWLFVGKGGGVFSPGVLVLAVPGDPYAPTVTAIAAADFNGDGKLDLAATYFPESGARTGILVIFGNGDGTFQAPTYYGGSAPAYITVGDATGHGYPDIVVPGATIYVNDGHGVFSKTIQPSVPGNTIAIGDLNGDGIPDLATSNGSVALGLGGGKFAPAVGYPVANTGGWYSVAMAQLKKSKKGFDDVITGLNSSVSVLLNNGKGQFLDGEWISVPGSGNCGAAADFNGDGKPDLAVPTSNGVTILLGTGSAAAPFTVGQPISVSGPACPITGDLNGDGIPDLLFGASGLGGVGAYLGNGDGTFRLASVISVGPATNIVLGDFNYDGKLDFADSSNVMALGNGDGIFQSPSPILSSLPPPGYMDWIVAGDLNKDGWTDLVYVAGIDGAGLYVLMNDQQGGFTQSTVAGDQGFNSLTLADLNGDGNLDVVGTAEAAFASIYLGNGAGGFTLLPSTLGFPFVDALPAQVGDVNGDGIPDLLLPADGSIGIALGKGNGTFLTPFVEGAGGGLGQILFETLHGQAAGFPDLVAPDSGGGVTVLINTTKPTAP